MYLDLGRDSTYMGYIRECLLADEFLCTFLLMDSPTIFSQLQRIHV